MAVQSVIRSAMCLRGATPAAGPGGAHGAGARARQFQPAHLLDEALALARELGDRLNVGWALLHQGTMAYRMGDPATARALLEEGWRAVRRSARRGGAAWAGG